MIKVQDWVASIPEEEKHVAYAGEGKSETREFLLCGDGWETYRQWGFYLDMAFDPESVTSRDSREVVETRVDTTKNTDETGVNTREVTTKESYTVEGEEVAWTDLTDIAVLSKQVTEEGLLLTWEVLYQHTRLPGRLWANLRAVGPDTQQVKKSAVMVFEVEPSVVATTAIPPTVDEFEQMEARITQLCEQAYQSADTAVSAASGAVQGQQQAMASAQAAAASAQQAQTSAAQAADVEKTVANVYNNTVHYAQTTSEQAAAAEASCQEIATMKETLVNINLNTRHHAQVATDKAIEAQEYCESVAAMKDTIVNINLNAKHHAQIATDKAIEASESAEAVAEAKTTVPTLIKPIAIPAFRLTEVAPLFDNLPTPRHDKDIKTMEEYDQGFGSILYRTSLPELKTQSVLKKNTQI